MTRFEFIAECNKALISPSLALENEDIEQALENGDDQEVIRILNEEY